MKFDTVIEFAISVVVAAYLAGRLPNLNRWVYIRTVKLLADSRSSAWGSPIFFPERK